MLCLNEQTFKWRYYLNVRSGISFTPLPAWGRGVNACCSPPPPPFIHFSLVHGDRPGQSPSRPSPVHGPSSIIAHHHWAREIKLKGSSSFPLTRVLPHQGSSIAAAFLSNIVYKALWGNCCCNWCYKKILALQSGALTAAIFIRGICHSARTAVQLFLIHESLSEEHLNKTGLSGSAMMNICHYS